jgi:phosphoglycerol transferase MdoB-like AlkP superfamily enzyme
LIFEGFGCLSLSIIISFFYLASFLVILDCVGLGRIGFMSTIVDSSTSVSLIIDDGVYENKELYHFEFVCNFLSEMGGLFLAS